MGFTSDNAHYVNFGGLVVATVVIVMVESPAARDRLLHRIPEPANDYYVIERIPKMHGPWRVTFKDVILVEQNAKTIRYVRNYRGRYAVVRRKPEATLADVDREMNSLLGPVRLTPLSGLFLLRLSLGEVAWAAIFGVYAFIAFRSGWRKPGERRYWLYGAAVLAAWGVFGVAAWSVIGQAVSDVRVEWTVGALIYITGSTCYLAACGLAVAYFWHDLRLRCRTCLTRLRLPLEEGTTGCMVVDPTTEATVCIYGHGTRTVGRWQDTWTPAGSYWEELLKTSTAHHA